MRNESRQEGDRRSDRGQRDDRRPTRPKGVYALTERDGKTYWTKIGAAFENRDGSLTLRLDALPVSGVINVREEREKEEG